MASSANRLSAPVIEHFSGFLGLTLLVVVLMSPDLARGGEWKAVTLTAQEKQVLCELIVEVENNLGYWDGTQLLQKLKKRKKLCVGCPPDGAP